MRKVLAIVAAGLLFLAPAVPAQEEAPPENASDAGFLQIELDPELPAFPWSPDLLASAAACIPASKCCKICDKGKACGNSCISRSYTCHKGRGCACDSVEVCG